MAELFAQIACAMPRELATKGLGWQDRAVYTEAIYYGRENLTDGVIARGALAFWMPDMPVKERVRRLDMLRERGALLAHPDGWAFPEHVWRKWGKTRAQVEEHREKEAERKKNYRDRKKGDATDESENVPKGRDVTATACPKQSDVEIHPEIHPHPDVHPSSSSQVNLRLVQQGTDDKGLQALRVLADEWTERFCESDAPFVRDKYLQSIYDNADDHLPALRFIATTQPDATIEEIATAYSYSLYDLSLGQTS